MGADVEKNVESVQEVSDFTDVVGGHGPWQRMIFLVFFLAAFPSAWHNLAMSFFAPNLNHWCARPSAILDANVSVDLWKRRAIPLDDPSPDDIDPVVAYNKCYQFASLNFTAWESESPMNNDSHPLRNDNDTVIVPCQKWEYDDSLYTNTVVSQWDLVCDREWLVSMTKSVFMAGFLTSVLVFGQLADKIGRKPVLMTCAIILVTSGVICAFSISFIMFTVSRFFVAIGISGIFNTGFVMLMEMVSAEYRSVFGIAVEFGWSTGYVMMPGIAWFVRDWFWLQLAFTLPCIGFFSLWWLVPESPRWLLTQGRTEKAQEVLMRVAEKNGKKAQEVENTLKMFCAKSAKNQSEDNRSCNMLDLIRTSGLWQKTINLYFNWFVNAFIYYGLSYNTNDLSGDPFVNFAIAGAVEFPAYFLSIFVIRSLGRRLPLMATMVAGGVACLLTVPMSDDLMWVRTPLAMFGKFCITASFGITYVYTTEIFPTVVRNTGLGTCSMIARIGSILAPFVRELGQATHPSVPLACYGALSIASGFLVLLLPETNNCKVPDTLQEAADFGRKVKQTKPIAAVACTVHENGEVKKPASPVISKPVSDGKKLPDLLEEPSVFEAEDNDQPSEIKDVSNIPNGTPEVAPEETTVEAVELVEAAPVTPETDTSDSTITTSVDDGSSQQTPL